MTTNQLKSGYFKTLSILFYALLIGLVMFFFIVVAFTFGGIVEANDNLTKIFLYAVPAMLIGSVLLSSSLYKRRLPEITANLSIVDKLAQYRGLAILRFAIQEGGVLFAIIALFITGSKSMVLLVSAGILLFISLRPRKEKIILDLQLSGREVDMLDE